MFDRVLTACGCTRAGGVAHTLGAHSVLYSLHLEPPAPAPAPHRDDVAHAVARREALERDTHHLLTQQHGAWEGCMQG